MRDGSNPTALLGLDLYPLPFESWLSAIGRLAYLNRLSPSRLESAFGVYMPSRAQHFSQMLTVSRKFTFSTGWEQPAEEKLMLSRFGELVDLYFAGAFRYCPVCLLHGYHSFWFQLRTLGSCPIHRRRLETKCSECCSELGPAARLFETRSRFYSCPHCRFSLCGVEFTQNRHRQFRELSALFRRSFGGLEAWAADAEQGLRVLRELVVQCSVAQWDVWCNPKRFLLEVAGGLIRPLNDAQNEPSHVIQIRWSLSLVDSCFRHNMRHSNIEMRLAKSQPVYRATLRVLQQWVYSKDQPHRPVEDLRRLMSDGHIALDGRDARQLALAWLRYSLEAQPETMFEWDNVRNARLRDELDIPRVGERPPRLQTRAALIAIFCVMTTLVERCARLNGRLDIDLINLNVRVFLPLVLLPRADHTTLTGDRSEGAAFFPSIAGLPLEKLWPGIRKISRISQVLQLQ